MNEALNAYIAKNKERMIETLREVVAIPSYRGEAAPGAPYGEGPAKVLGKCLEIARRLGFETVNVDNHCGYAEYGRGEESVGIFAHYDVVPEGQGWTYPPYAGEIHDGWIYGRGVVDNKGPGIASLFGLKAIMDLGLPIKRRIRMVFGINEETGMEDIKYYVKKLGAPMLGFSPDAQFPVSFAEKAGATVHVGKKLSGIASDGLGLVRLYGGDAPETIADTCEATLLAKDAEQADHVMWKLAMFAEKTAWNLRGKRDGLEMVIYSIGKTGHPYTPRLGQNAISQLIMFLDRIGIQGEAGQIIHTLREAIGMEYYGEHLGIDREDESGFLTFSNTRIDLDAQQFSATFKLYRPYYFNMEDLVESIEQALSPAGLRVTGYVAGTGVMRDKHSPLIRKLSQVYGEMTGLPSEPRAVGGTYAKFVPTICGFGAIFPGTKDMCHVVDEGLNLEEFVLLGQIYANAIYELATMDG